MDKNVEAIGRYSKMNITNIIAFIQPVQNGKIYFFVQKHPETLDISTNK